MLPESARDLISEFRNFPTVGARTATRFVLHLIKLPEADFERFISQLSQIQHKIKLCQFCFKPYQPNGQLGKLCELCSNKSREQNQLCVVEKETDLEALENTKSYRGLYFILGGLVNRLRKEDLRALRVRELKARLAAPTKFGLGKGKFSEIILAINPTSEGEATSLYLEREFKVTGIKITRLGRGLPTGGELEYADEETILSALQSRR